MPSIGNGKYICCKWNVFFNITATNFILNVSSMPWAWQLGNSADWLNGTFEGLSMHCGTLKESYTHTLVLIIVPIKTTNRLTDLLNCPFEWMDILITAYLRFFTYNNEKLFLIHFIRKKTIENESCLHHGVSQIINQIIIISAIAGRLACSRGNLLYFFILFITNACINLSRCGL